MTVRRYAWAACIVLGTLAVVSTPGLGERSADDFPPGQIQTLQPGSGVSTQLSDEQRADVFMARKEYERAVDYYGRAVQEYTHSFQPRERIARAWNKMGIAYQQGMQFREAQKAYKKAIRFRPDLAEAWNNLGTTYYLENKPKKSLRYYERAIKLSPLSPGFHLNLGTAYFARKKYDDGLREYRTALQIDPDILQEYSPMGTAIQTRQTNAEFYFNMAKIFASLGRPAEAIRYLQRALEEGFADRDRILKDADLQKISNDPAFTALMKNPPAPIRN